MTETCTVYCLICKTACCNLCLSETSAHLNHQIQPINNFSKSQKVCSLFLIRFVNRLI
jgi:hypothetical protein